LSPIEVPMLDLGAQRRRLGATLTDAITAVLDRGDFVLGAEVGRLEDARGSRAGGAEVVSCASGTDALVLALRALDVGPGDAVVVPAFTFAATAEAVVLVGAQPVFADVREDTFNLDPESLAEVAGGVPDHVRGVISVDLFGQPADHRSIARVAVEHGLFVLSDAAQSLGATADGRPVGQLTPVTTTSFYPPKPLGAFGDGGAVLTTDPSTAGVVRSLRNHGCVPEDRYRHERVGLASRLDTLQAAVLLAKLTVFDDELRRRREIAAAYTAGLEDVVAVPHLLPGASSAWAQYTITCDHRDDVQRDLAAAGVASAVHYPLALCDQPAFAGLPQVVSLAHARSLAGRVLSLPLHPYLSDEQVAHVIGSLHAAVGRTDG
jgi:dTDP-4-amino-4,6-dideoxygalactose transaminase